MSEVESKKFYEKTSFRVFVFVATIVFIFLIIYFLGYFSSPSKVEIKSPTQAVSYQNNMQKTMDRLKELLLGDNETQEAGKKNEFLEKEIKEIAEKFTMATPSNPSRFERRVKRAAKVGDAVISELLTKIQASVARQEESIEALRVCLKVLLKKGKEGHPSVALIQERVVAHNRESDLCRMLLENVNFLQLKLEGDKGESLFELTNVEIPLQQRVAGGRAQVASANLQRLKWERNGLEDRISAEVKDVLSAINAARQRITLSYQQQKAAQQLEEGEKTRFELGDTTLLFVNLREIASGDAMLQAADANSSLFKADADYQAILATPLSLAAGVNHD